MITSHESSRVEYTSDIDNYFLVDSSNDTESNLKKILHETQENLANHTLQYEKLKHQMNLLTVQKNDRENVLIFELSKIKEAHESTADELKSLKSKLEKTTYEKEKA